MFNDDLEYASSRLVNTVVKLKSFEEGGVLSVQKIYSGAKYGSNSFKEAIINGYDKKLNPINIKSDSIEYAFGPLGYVTTQNRGLSYLTRSPIRRDYKQGLRANQLSLVTINKDKAADRLRTSVKDTELFTFDFLGQLSICAHNKYKPLDEVLEDIEEKGLGFGISRHFALDTNYNLHYRAILVGRLLDSGLLKLNTGFNFLEQELAIEVGNERLAKL